MDNNQQDITADLTDALLRKAAADAWLYNSGTDSETTTNLAFRNVAALAREGWRPIPQDEGDVITLFERRANSCHLVPSAADEKSQELAAQLCELAEILTRMGFVTLAPPAWPSRLQRAAELLVHQQAFQRVLTSERPWERPGWCDDEGRCWMGRDPGGGEFVPSWRLCCPWSASHLKWCAPHWAICVPPTGEES